MTVSDDGGAFQVERILDDHGLRRLGLLGMRERLAMVGGRLTITSATGTGTLITAEVPIPPSKRRNR